MIFAFFVMGTTEIDDVGSLGDGGGKDKCLGAGCGSFLSVAVFSKLSISFASHFLQNEASIAFQLPFSSSSNSSNHSSATLSVCKKYPKFCALLSSSPVRIR